MRYLYSPPLIREIIELCVRFFVNTLWLCFSQDLQLDIFKVTTLELCFNSSLTFVWHLTIWKFLGKPNSIWILIYIKSNQKSLHWKWIVLRYISKISEIILFYHSASKLYFNEFFLLLGNFSFVWHCVAVSQYV